MLSESNLSDIMKFTINLLNPFQQYLVNNPELTENAAKTYCSDLSSIIQAVFKAYNNTLQTLI